MNETSLPGSRFSSESKILWRNVRLKTLWLTSFCSRIVLNVDEAAIWNSVDAVASDCCTFGITRVIHDSVSVAKRLGNVCIKLSI